jgi:hypothetical protein
LAPDFYYGQAGTALVCFHDAFEAAARAEHPRNVFHPLDPEASKNLLYQEHVDLMHYVSSLSEPRSSLLDSGSTINTVGKVNILQEYSTPFPSSTRMLSATGRILRPVGQCHLRQIGGPVTFHPGKYYHHYFSGGNL